MIGFCPGLIFAWIAVYIVSWSSRKYLAILPRMSESELLKGHEHLRRYVIFYKTSILISFFISFMIFAGLFFGLLALLAPSEDQGDMVTEVAIAFFFPYMVFSHAIANGIFELTVGLTGIGEKQNIWHHFSGIGKGRGNPYYFLYGDEVRCAGKLRAWIGGLFVTLLIVACGLVLVWRL